MKVGNARTSSLPQVNIDEYPDFSGKWARNTLNCLAANAHFYVWLGADYKNNFQPLPEFMLMMRDFPELSAKNFITMRNQRGYGTHNNWMWVRQ